jgi:ribosomal protein S18 acetylase RimI-like enzyme
VDQAARRTGLGSSLLAAAISRARARGCARVELDTHEANAAALALYERFGFSPNESTGERKVFMRLVFDPAS